MHENSVSLLRAKLFTNFDTSDTQDSCDQTKRGAIWFAGLGYKIFPCSSDKRPLVKWTQFHSDDQNQIIEWWQQYPNAMIGLPCGPINGIAVLDIDVKNEVNGFQSLADQGFEIPPNTLQVNTPSGGAHFYFRLRPDEVIKNSAGKIGPGVDVRGDGGYVIAPPSVSASGTYRVANASDWSLFKELRS